MNFARVAPPMIPCGGVQIDTYLEGASFCPYPSMRNFKAKETRNRKDRGRFFAYECAIRSVSS
jgi:hypothetical protein